MESTPKIEFGDRLYFNQWKHCATFFQQEAWCLRGLNIDQILQNIQRQRFRLKGVKNLPWHIELPWENNYQDGLLCTFEYLSKTDVPFKLTIFSNWCSVYSNDLGWLQTMQDQLPHTKYWRFKSREIDRAKNTILLKNTQYQHRTFFKDQYLNNDQMLSLSQWFQAQGDQIKLSNSAQRWLAGLSPRYRQNYCMRYFNFDHNNLYNETMVNLIVPGIIRTTMHLINR